MKKIFVTTFNKKLFDEYAHSLIETYIQTKQILPLYCYVEDDVGLYPKFENVFFLNLFHEQPESKNFINRNLKKQHELAESVYLLNAIRFSYKVFAQNDARKYGDHIFYLDSDISFIKTIPENWYNACLPENVFLTLYERLGHHTEAGFLAFNNKLKNCKNTKISDIFFSIYLNFYKLDSIFCLPSFTDCHALDATRYRMLFLQPYVNEYNEYKEKKLGDSLCYVNRNFVDIMGEDRFTGEYFIHEKGYKKSN